MHYKVSVIVPVYNAREYLPRCVESLMRQTLREIEYIFVEDCSTDGSYEVLLEALSGFPERKDDVRIIRHGTNKGVSVSRNDGYDAATGDYLIHCDSDDWVDVTMYGKMYEKAMAEGADICMSDFYAVTENGLEHRHPDLDCSQPHHKIVNDYLIWVWNTLWNILVARSVYERCNVRLPEDLTFTEDFYLSSHLFLAARKITTVREPLYYYYMDNSASIVHTISAKAMMQELSCYERVIDSMKEKGVYEHYHRTMQWRLVKAVCSLVMTNRFDEFRSIHPESHRYIITTPSAYFKPKVKIKLLLTVMRLDFICRWDNMRHGRG